MVGSRLTPPAGSVSIAGKGWHSSLPEPESGPPRRSLASPRRPRPRSPNATAHHTCSGLSTTNGTGRAQPGPAPYAGRGGVGGSLPPLPQGPHLRAWRSPRFLSFLTGVGSGQAEPHAPHAPKTEGQPRHVREPCLGSPLDDRTGRPRPGPDVWGEKPLSPSSGSSPWLWALAEPLSSLELSSLAAAQAPPLPENFKVDARKHRWPSAPGRWSVDAGRRVSSLPPPSHLRL